MPWTHPRQAGSLTLSNQQHRFINTFFAACSHEPTLDKLVPPHRRGNNNLHCVSVAAPPSGGGGLSIGVHQATDVDSLIAAANPYGSCAEGKEQAATRCSAARNIKTYLPALPIFTPAAATSYVTNLNESCRTRQRLA
eukprot:223751-Pelagomonas_calceolata.AAC.4